MMNQLRIQVQQRFLHQIQRDDEFYFALREVDTNQLRPNVFGVCEAHPRFSFAGTCNEAAKRAYIRQVCRDLKLILPDASPDEQELQRHTRCLPARAPKASLISVQSVVLLQQGFGMQHGVEAQSTVLSASQPQMKRIQSSVPSVESVLSNSENKKRRGRPLGSQNKAQWQMVSNAADYPLGKRNRAALHKDYIEYTTDDESLQSQHEEIQSSNHKRRKEEIGTVCDYMNMIHIAPQVEPAIQPVKTQYEIENHGRYEHKMNTNGIDEHHNQTPIVEMHQYQALQPTHKHYSGISNSANDQLHGNTSFNNFHSNQNNVTYTNLTPNNLTPSYAPYPQSLPVYNTVPEPPQQPHASLIMDSCWTPNLNPGSLSSVGGLLPEVPSVQFLQPNSPLLSGSYGGPPLLHSDTLYAPVHHHNHHSLASYTMLTPEVPSTGKQAFQWDCGNQDALVKAMLQRDDEESKIYSVLYDTAKPPSELQTTLQGIKTVDTAVARTLESALAYGNNRRYYMRMPVSSNLGMTTIRAFRATDLLRFNSINADYLTETFHLGMYAEYMSKWPEMFRAALAPSGAISGYMMGKVEGPDKDWHGHVSAVTIAPAYRRLGLARNQMNELEQTTEQKHKAYFVDQYVRSSNIVAIKMYKALGYIVYRRVLQYYGDEDAYDMRKATAYDVNKSSEIPRPAPSPPEEWDMRS